MVAGKNELSGNIGISTAPHEEGAGANNLSEGKSPARGPSNLKLSHRALSLRRSGPDWDSTHHAVSKVARDSLKRRASSRVCAGPKLVRERADRRLSPFTWLHSRCRRLRQVQEQDMISQHIGSARAAALERAGRIVVWVAICGRACPLEIDQPWLDL
jgi:hypothetical protein